MIEAPARQADDIAVYLRSIEGTPLLTAEEEVELGKRVQAGDQAARQRFIEANLRLVVNIAKQFGGKSLPLMEIIEEGNVGLIKAVERFDPAHGNRFSTYAVWWIKQSIRRALPNAQRTVRIPTHIQQTLSDYRRKAEAMRVAGDGSPVAFEDVVEAMQLSPARISMLRSAMRTTVSVDEQADGSEDHATLAERLRDDRGEDPGSRTAQQDHSTEVSQLIEAAKLDTRERDILRMRYGIGRESPMQIAEVAGHYRMSKERIRQIEVGALRKLHEYAQALAAKE